MNLSLKRLFARSTSGGVEFAEPPAPAPDPAPKPKAKAKAASAAPAAATQN